MKPLSLKYGTFTAAVAAGWLLDPSCVRASQLAYEGFNYATGTANVTGMTGGFGWSGAWATVNNGSADVVTGNLSGTGITPTGYDANSSGNSCFLPNARRIGRRLDTSTTGLLRTKGYRDANGRIGADNKTIYISFLQQPNDTTSYYEFEFHRGDLGDGGRIAGIGNDQAGSNVNLRAPNNVHTAIGAGTTGVNFYVVRIDFKAGNDDVYVYRNPTSATEPGTPTLTKLAAADMSFDGVSFGAFVNGRTVAHDEVRIGETWTDVTLPPVVAPAITAQPKTPTAGYVGGGVTLTASATGQPLPTYQWYKGNTALNGQTGASLTLSNLQTGDAGLYHVVATNSQGNATSSDAQVNVQTAPAGLLAYEGFDYSTGSGSVPGKGGGLGWGAAWANVDGPGGTVQSGNLAAGNNGPNGYDAQSSGNSLFIPNGQRDGRLLDTTTTGRFGVAGYIDGAGNIGANGKTLYVSFLQQPDGATKFYEFEFHRGNLGDPGRIGGVGNDTGNPTVALRTGNLQTLIGSGNTGVNLYVVRIDYKDGNDDVYVYQNPVSATEPGVPTLTMLGVSDMSFNGISMGAFDNGRTVKHDEIRLGQSWSDVMFGTSRRDLVWKGDGTTNAWNTTTQNWTANAVATAFADGDPVTFDDGGSASPAVSIPASVSTGALTVSNNTKNYTFGGAGTVNVSGSLAKSGSGSLTVNNTANFGSVIAVDDGTLALNGTTTAGGGLNAYGGATTLNGTSTLGSLVTTSGNLTIKGPTTIAGAGALVWMGNLTGADCTVTMENGGSLSMTGTMADSWVIGRDGGSCAFVQNGGTITYNPTNRGEAYIGASIPDTTLASYTLNDGTLDMINKRLQLGLGPITGTLTQKGGTLRLNQLSFGGVLSSGSGGGVFHMDAGSLTVGAGGFISPTLQYEIAIKGGSITAAADWSSELDMSLTGGAIPFDTAGHVVSISGWLSGTGSLTKNGDGTLVLLGFNTQTGATALNAGTLAGAGVGEGSVLTTATGTTVDPGDPVLGFTGTFATKSATLATGSTLKIDIDSSSGTADQLSATGAITLTGVNAAFGELTGGTLPAGTNLTIVKAGTTLTGTFVGLAEGATISAGANTYAIHYQAKQVVLTVVAGSPYSSWASAHGLDGTPGKDPAFDADPEGDGVPNGLEWILGGEPLVSDASSLVTVTGSPANGLTLSFKRVEASLGAMSLYVQWSSTLGGTWTDVPITQAGGTNPNGVTVTVNQTATPDAVTVVIPASNAVGGKLFARFRVTMP